MITFNRNIIKAALIIVSGLILSFLLFSCGKISEKQNILFIAIDDQNDWIQCFGGHPQVKTPNIDELAARGTRFTNAHCAVPICGPSRASLFTGRQPWNTGIYTNSVEELKSVGTRFKTLLQELIENGYNTYGAGKVFHGPINRYPEGIFTAHGPKYNQFQPLTFEEARYTDAEFNSGVDKVYLTHEVDRGSDKLQAIFPLNKMPRERRLGSRKIESFDWGPLPVSDEEMSDYQTADWVIDKLNENHDKPFFLAAGFYRPHIPLYIPQKYYDMYPPDKIQLPEFLKDDLVDIPGVGKDFALKAYSAGSHKNVIDHKQWREAVACYLACVTFVDEQVGRIIKALDESAYRDNTTIVLWGDNGWHLGEKEHWGKFAGWEESTRIPLIMVTPKNKKNEFLQGADCVQPVSLIDLYPTMMAINGIPVRPELDGKSLVPLLHDPDLKHQDHVISTFGRGNHSIRTEQWRYTRYYDGSEELYNLSLDSNEFKNLGSIKEFDTIKQELKNQLPVYNKIDYFVSMGFWKAVIYKDRDKTELFNFHDNKAVPEEKNVYNKHPEVVDKMLAYIVENNITQKYLSIPE
jgi:arylsulfatase A-like enzyme